MPLDRTATPLRATIALLATLAGLLAEPAKGTAASVSPATAADGIVIPFAVDGEPAAWARRVVPAHLSPLVRVRTLSRALLAPGARPIVEAMGHTPTAGELFAERRGNCVGYANLFVGLARELGLPVYFVLVDNLPGATSGARREDSLAVSEGHLAAAWGAGESLRVFDLAGETDGRELRVRPITDLAAIAVFYSNRGIEALLAGDGGSAVTWLKAAAGLEPVALPSTWVNLGVALRRAGDLEAARLAYERALDLDPAAGAAYRNLAALLTQRGDSRRAEELLATAAELARLDSMAALQLARQRLLEGHLQEARGLYRRALELSQPDPRH